MTTWRFPLLSDVPRDQWPTSLKVRPPDPSLGGDVERVYCGCKCYHTADDIFDLRSVPATFGLPAFTCTHCFHYRTHAGIVRWGALARALGCTDAAVLASFDGTDARPPG